MARKPKKTLVGSILMIALGVYLAYDGYSATTEGTEAALTTGVLLGGVLVGLGAIFLLVALARRSTWKEQHGSDPLPGRGRRAPGTSTGWEHLVVPGSPALPGYPAPPELKDRPALSPPPLPPPVDQNLEPVR